MGKMVGLVGMIYVYIHNPGEYCVDMISPPRFFFHTLLGFELSVAQLRRLAPISKERKN